MSNIIYTQYCSYCNRTIKTPRSKSFCIQCEGLMETKNATPKQSYLTKLARVRGFKDEPLTDGM